MRIKQFAEKHTEEARYENCHKANGLAKDIWELATKANIITEKNRLSYQTSFFKLREGPEIAFENTGPEYGGYCVIRVKTIEDQSEQYARIRPKKSTDPRDPETAIIYTNATEMTEHDYLSADIELIEILEQVKTTLASGVLAEPIAV